MNMVADMQKHQKRYDRNCNNKRAQHSTSLKSIIYKQRILLSSILSPKRLMPLEKQFANLLYMDKHYASISYISCALFLFPQKHLIHKHGNKPTNMKLPYKPTSKKHLQHNPSIQFNSPHKHEHNYGYTKQSIDNHRIN